jgi:hypothetical protein
MGKGTGGSGGVNAAHGLYALFNNVQGSYNTAIGPDTLVGNADGSWNTAVGAEALNTNVTGGQNAAVGGNALLKVEGSSNVALGYNARSAVIKGDNNIEIDNIGATSDSGKIRIGTRGVQNSTYVAGIYSATTSRGLAVYCDANGKLGTLQSSRQVKEEIQPMTNASEVILSLQPVRFRYKKELDPEKTVQFGLIAEEVEKVDPDLIVRDEKGRPYSVRYEAVNAMLLNEFLKEHRKVLALEKAMAEQRKENGAILATLQKQAVQIEKVNAQLQTGKAVPELADYR